MKKKYFILGLAILISSFTKASEFIFEVKMNRRVIVEIDGEMQSLRSNHYFFSDIEGYNLLLKVSDRTTGHLLYQGHVDIPRNHEVHAELSEKGRFKTLSSKRISVHNNPAIEHRPNWGDWVIRPVAVDQKAFNQFMTVLKSESFDKGRMEVSQYFITKNRLHTGQIAEMAKTFSFDESRLDFVKSAYGSCVDPENYLLLKDVFSFQSSYKDLLKFLSTR